MSLTSAAPLLALLNEPDDGLKSYALKSLNDVVDQLWAEIANNIAEIEELYENDSFTDRKLAALLASKVYYNLGDYDSSVKYSLYSGDAFDIDEKTEFVETVVSKCINYYISLSQQKYSDASVEIDPQLTEIFERMLRKCVESKELKLAIGISLESYRLDIVKSILDQNLEDEELSLNLISYVLTCATTVILDASFRTEVLNSLVLILTALKNTDYFIISKIIVQLNDYKLAHRIFTKLVAQDLHLTAFQVAFDLVNAASQELLDKTIEILKNDPTFKASEKNQSKIIKILTGVPTCDLDITFLNNNNNTDISILNKTKLLLDGRNSIFHSAVTFENAFMHAGTTDDSFFRSNLEWLGKATNWSKFSATAALGVIHRGNLSRGFSILQPYLPGSSGSHFTKGGSLYGLGLIYAGHGREVIEYLRNHVVENAGRAGSNDSSENQEVDVILHGACLGVGVAAMGLGSSDIFEELKTILYADSAISGEAAALGIGLVMLGSGLRQAADDLLTYAEETKHENIIRGLAIAIALIYYGKETESEAVVSKMIAHQNPVLRYGACFTLALAYCGTGNNSAIQRLLHIAVSDSSDSVRRASVTSLGFILLRDYTTVPTIVELLSESHNPHVRYGTAMALGISCAGRGLPAAIEVLEPLTKDPVDFVRQGALIATSMILIQQTEKTFSKVKEVKENLANVIGNKNQDALAKYGAALAQGIIDAGGRNVTIQLENAQTNTLNAKAIVGLTLFTQSWYWYPLAHFLSLSFTATSIIGVREDLKVPKFHMNCHTKEDLFCYPPKVEETKEKQPDKVATAVLSTTNRARARAKKAQAEKVKREDKMDVDEDDDDEDMDSNGKASSADATTTGTTSSDQQATEASVVEELPNDIEEPVIQTNYTKTPYQVSNMSRILPDQLKYIAFVKDGRFVPVRRFRGANGIVVLKDTKPEEPVDAFKTVRQLNNNEAPLPDSFTLEDSDDEE